MRPRLLPVLAALLLGTGLAAQEADEAIRRHPGFVELSALGLFAEEDLEVHVSVKGPMLDLVAASTRESDPDLSAMVGGLEAVEVLVYKAPAERRKGLESALAAAATGLEGRGWATAVTLRTREAFGHVLLRLREGKPMGLAAMYLGEEEESVLVNIVGEIEPAQIGRLAQRFNIDFLAQGAFQPPEEP